MEKLNNFIEIPTFKDGQWSVTEFSTKEEFRDFLLPLFKEPGTYGFDEVSKVFNAEGRKFQTQGYYCQDPFKSKDFFAYNTLIS